MNAQISLSASGGIPPGFGQAAGIVDITTPGNLTVGGSGRLMADTGLGDGLDRRHMASSADGSVAQADNEGDITMIVGTLTSLGEFHAAGQFGDVDLTANAGPMTLAPLAGHHRRDERKREPHDRLHRRSTARSRWTCRSSRRPRRSTSRRPAT